MRTKLPSLMMSVGLLATALVASVPSVSAHFPCAESGHNCGDCDDGGNHVHIDTGAIATGSCAQCGSCNIDELVRVSALQLPGGLAAVAIALLAFAL